MRENRLSGSEGGGVEANRLSLPLYPRIAPISARLRCLTSCQLVAARFVQSSGTSDKLASLSDTGEFTKTLSGSF